MQIPPIPALCCCQPCNGYIVINGTATPGPPGPAGPQGPTGPQGPRGTADVILTDPTEDGGSDWEFAVNIVCSTFWYWNPIEGAWHSLSLDVLKARPTIVELRQIDTVTCAPPDMVFTKGNLVQGDDQAAPYRFDPDSLDADDGMSTILPDDRAITDPGRWKQIVFA